MPFATTRHSTRSTPPKPYAPPTPFALLRRAFMRRFLDNELLSFGAEAGPQALIWIGALMLAPSLLWPFNWMARYAWASMQPPGVLEAMRWTDGLRLIQLSMVSTGFATALVWEALLLDRRDVLVLAPLPISWRTVIAAKLTALTTAWGAFALAINLPPSYTFASIAIREGLTAYAFFFLTQLAVTLGASAFVFTALIALQALLLNTVSAAAFRRLVMAVQALAFFAMLTLLLLQPLMSSNEWSRALAEGSSLRWFPPIWFLGLAETWRGPASPEFQAVGRVALLVTIVSVLLAGAGFGLGFRRYVRRAIESPEVGVRGASGSMTRIARRVAHVAVRYPAERATFDFVLRSLARSPRHRLLVGGALGIGLAIMLPSLLALLNVEAATAPPVPTAAMLRVPLALSFLLLAAVRLGFRLPTDIGASWVIRLAERPDTRPYLAGMRKATFAVSVLPPALLCAPLYARAWSVWLVLAHVLFCALVGLVLVNALLARFRSMPYACTVDGISDPRPARWQLYLLGFFLYASSTAAIEAWLLADGVRFAVGCAVLAAGLTAVAWIRRLRAGDPRTGLVFDIEPAGASVALNLAMSPSTRG